MNDAATGPVATPPPNPLRLVARQYFRNGLATASLVLLVVIVAACILAPLLTGSGPNETDLSNSLTGPSANHLLGTDQLGRDLLTRLLYGGRSTLFHAALVSVVAVAIAVPLGMVAAYLGGWVDRAAMSLTDIGLSLPAMVVMLVVVSVFSGHPALAMVALGFLLAPPIVRNVRGPALAVKGELFVDAAVVAGLPARRIIFRDVLPRVIGPVLVQGALAAAIALQFTVGLSFLGFGADPPDPDWGSMIAEGSQVLNTSPWPLLAGGLALGLVSLALVLVGDGIRDAAVEAWSGAPPSRRRSRKIETKRPGLWEPSAGQGDQEVAIDHGEPALLTLRHVSVAHSVDGGSTCVASDVSFAIAPGESVGIVGESGCGKSSISRAIARLLPQGGQITGGVIEFEGRDVAALSGRPLYDYRRRAVSYIAQDPMTALDPTLRVGVLLRRIVQASDNVSRKAAEARVLELLEQVQLPNPAAVARHYPHELSGGMAQRIGIARAIATRPRLLIADEPTTALDVTVQSEILSLLRSLQEELGMAVLLVSHDWGVVAQVCDRALVMYAGELVEHGRLDRITHEPAHPYTSALLACRPSDILDDDLPLPTIRGSVSTPGEWPVGCRFASRCDYSTESCRTAPVGLTEMADEHAVRCVRPLRAGSEQKEVSANV
ncbi:dipeptide/oligopeptide/nickel ABC transporter permease/ATP-binding protein [Cryptosporangium sp. NPDC051539]|uniref:dipeptide/oligopeptide/nickel ABC transporter permease/ATP-binding protein n=1 Tax=Cryptosporangium sp. NPDC051539 TaxID=3363962 RepID=UPI00379E5FBD